MLAQPYKTSRKSGLVRFVEYVLRWCICKCIGIFALGIMPYISASIVVQLLGMAIPYFQKLQKEGESGRKKD